MELNNQLNELIERAACSMNMLDTSDEKEVGKLQEVMHAINETISKIDDGSLEIVKEAQAATTEASELLQTILNDQVQDAAQSLTKVNQQICVLQDLIDQIMSDAGDTQTGEISTPQNNAEQQVEQAAVIAEEDVPLVLDFITESDEHIESAEAGLLQLEHTPDDSEVLNQVFRAFHTIKGMAGFLNLGDIGSLAHAAENLLDLARKGQCMLTGEKMNLVFESIDMLKKTIADLASSIEAGEPVPVHLHLQPLLEKLKTAVEQTADDALNSPEAPQYDQKLDAMLGQNHPAKSSCTAPEEHFKTHARGEEKIKVSMKRLDNLINMVGELVIAQLMVAEQANTKLASEHELGCKIAHQNKIIRELQELSMSMRMIPIAGVFQKMARLVRDLSHKSGKRVRFSTSGDETELDRNIVDKIADPLVHMIRNSVDHGIESADERAQAGKNPTGYVELRAFHQAGHIIIEIEDDGKGLDRDRILKKAVDNGIVKSGQDMNDDEVYKLIFHAGLSTAQKITSVSGRGVGMDVVKKNIESLRGKIDIRSQKGKGTVFTISLPLTLAIIDGQIITIGEERYIVPINSIVRTLRPKKEQISSVQNRGEMVHVRGQLLPLIRLYELFDLKPGTTDPTESLLVIVETNGQHCCMLVDELLGQQQIVIKSLGDGLGKLNGVSGAAIMGDGKVSLILDIPGIMKLAQQ